MSQRDYAFIGAAFWLALSAALILYGTHSVRVLMMMALLLGAYGQFIAQDNGAGWAPVFASYAAMALAFATLVVFGLSA